MTALAIAMVTLGVLGFAAYLMWLGRTGAAEVKDPEHMVPKAVAGLIGDVEKLTARVGALELQLALRRGPTQPKASPHA